MTDSPFIKDVTEQSFNAEVIERSLEMPVLVDFWADWCAPCRSLMPLLQQIVESYQGQIALAKVNSDQEQALATSYGVRSLPTVKLFKQGAPVDEFMGAQPESVIREMIERHLPREEDFVLQEALVALRAGEPDKGLALLDKAYAMAPQNKAVALSYANARISGADYAAARQALSGLGLQHADDPDVKELQARLDFAEAVGGDQDRATLENRLADNPADHEARYALGAHAVLAGDYETALEHFLKIVQLDRGWRDDGGRKAMLAVFDLLGGGPLVNRYRAKMASALH